MLAHSERPSSITTGATGGNVSGGAGSGPVHTNRLASEQSPYLLQHAHNPVDWYPWGEEAFARARAEDKPIFLSVGYATCHWCHVMERESFEDVEVAELLNRDFIAVKVDREERPDVDRVYMSYVQAVTGSGGWPMSVWLTPELEPFYGGTYYPPKDRFMGGMMAQPGFGTVLRRIASLWRTQRADLRLKATTTLAQLTEALQPGQQADASPASPESAAVSPSAGFTPSLAAAVVDACALDIARRYDAEYGGFGGAPKFPRPSEVNLMLRAQARQAELGDPLGAKRLRGMALHSLGAMAGGGMYDVLGGGFHRYSVDELWHVPHFEKMLYDNPQLAATYTAAFQLTGERRYAQVVRGVLDYLLRDLASPQGGLYSAEDADSADPHSFEGTQQHQQHQQAAATERREGAFYVWDYAQVNAVLGPELGPLFCLAYGIREEGNCDRSERSDPHGEFEGKNVPYGAMTAVEAATCLGLPYAGDAVEAERRLASAREALHAVRAARPRPPLDDKIVTAWNGMALGAFALASRALAAEQVVERLFPSEGRPASAYLEAARRVAAFVRTHLWDGAAGGGAGRLRRSFCKGPSAVPGFADDYAAMVAGLLDLYECGGGREWLEWAMELQAVQDELFWDEQSGGYYSTPDPSSEDADRSIRIRIKDDYDGAEPAASSQAAANLLRLADLAPQRTAHGGAAAAALPYADAAERTLSAFARRLTQAPLAVPQLCCAAHLFSKRPLRQVIVAGRSGSADTGALLDAVHGPWCPDKVVLVLDPTDPRDMRFWSAHNSAAHDMVAAHFAKRPQGAGVAATVFICQNFTCQAPTTDPAKVRELLGRPQVPPTTAQVKHFDTML
ncbi:hypothetical protein GPECTOR_6g884 [Gonium pectorale]|uniref:Spermatogenesis-associated protein 20-like TRX domain-containing protein n=1 Tax=Gonium pectorale TaxID=33097 RepID=A0A150GVW4_GONPE|nr:hypothetical protein GPECTOR_6g884 [Gonium pectorale]|eukprot:KXZ53965.1 hypothetical protein GPECTOR_6g884 [Gonium pectorale]